jgi:hypothetical protein
MVTRYTILILVLTSLALPAQSQFGSLSDKTFLGSSAAPFTTDFYTNGLTTPGGSTASTSRQIASTPITNTFGKSLRLVKIIMYGNATGGGPMTAAVHDLNSSKSSTAVLATNTTVGTIRASAGWNEMEMNYVVTNGQIYGLSVWPSNACTYYYNNLSAGSERITEVGANTGWPNWGASFVANTSSTNRQASVYGVYQNP